MSTPIERSSHTTRSTAITENPNRQLPYEVFLLIFKRLEFEDLVSVSLTCRDWRTVATDPTTMLGKYLKDKRTIENLSRIRPRYSAWEHMPRHWGLYTKENVLKFSSIDQGIIAFHPPFCNQSSKFFSFERQLPLFSNRDIFLGRYKNTYFLTPQGETRLKLDLPTDLQPFASYRLIAINMDGSGKKREFSLLEDLPLNKDNLSRCQIEECFPLSETRVAIVTRGGTLSFWEIFSSGGARCYKKIPMERSIYTFRVNNHLVLDNKIIDLDQRNLEFKDHGYQFRDKGVITFSSNLCAYASSGKEISYFTLGKGGLENKWKIDLRKQLESIEESNGEILNFRVRDMNEKFIVVSCSRSQAITLIILNTQGKVVHRITEKMERNTLEDYNLYRYPIFAHLSGVILVYKSPESDTICFWDLSEKKCIKKFDWKTAVYDGPSSRWGSGALVQDVRLSGSKLTILLSAYHTPGSNKPGIYRLIQFDPKLMKEPRISEKVKDIWLMIRGMYYAFPPNPLE